MKFVKAFCVLVITALQMNYAYAENDDNNLPTITMMADAELRNEVVTTVTPFQEDPKVREALQYQILKKEQNIQNLEIAKNLSESHIPQQNSLPDMTSLTPLQQAYVLSVASSFQSSDPTAGVFKMLEPLGVDRDKALNIIRMGTPLEFKLDENMLNQLLGR